MAGIYIHIPYCKQACTYCDFFFSTNLSTKNNFIESLLQEIKLRANFFEGQEIETVYFGGGTPSLLSANEIAQILKAIDESFSAKKVREITLEANPENLTQSYLQELKNVGINRLSIGLQSFKADELKEMNRSHNVSQNFEVIKFAKEIGFKNISVDLIYGTPWSSENEWEQFLNEVIKLDVQHISCYQLTVEDKTVLAHQIRTKKTKPLDDELTERQFFSLIDLLAKAGFEHYEISNFAKPGFLSQHNSNYWRNVPYLGLGPSAHSYSGVQRFSNLASIHSYISRVNSKESWFEVENLSEKDSYNDSVLTGLRSKFGVDLVAIEKKLGQSFVNYFQRKAQPYLESGKIIKSGYTYCLDEKAFLFADKISADLFYI